MKHLPAVLFIIDGNHEQTAIKEAKRLGIPTFGIIDSNTDPRGIDYPIPANDDSMKTIKLISNFVADTIIEATGGTSNYKDGNGKIDEDSSSDESVESKLDLDDSQDVESNKEDNQEK